MTGAGAATADFTAARVARDALAEDARPEDAAPDVALAHRPRRASVLRRVVLVGVVVGVGALCMLLDLYAVEPLFQQRAQRHLLAEFRDDLARAANEGSGLPGAGADPTAPATGAPIALLEIERLGLRQIVAEGADSATTADGPGHVSGSAGLGQRGDAVVVGRRATNGGPFRHLDQMRVGDELLVTTAQGQSIYEVEEVARRPLSDAERSGSSARGSRLTLVSSASRSPLNASEAIVVEAALDGKPFEATPQRPADSNRPPSGDAGAWPLVIASFVALAASVAGAVWLYRRLTLRIAYLIATVPVVVLLIVASESVSRLLPAWS